MRTLATVFKAVKACFANKRHMIFVVQEHGDDDTQISFGYAGLTKGEIPMQALRNAVDALEQEAVTAKEIHEMTATKGTP